MSYKLRQQAFVVSSVVIFVLLIILMGATLLPKDIKRNNQVDYNNIPTFFFHGGGSNYHAEDQMVNAAQKDGVTSTVIIAFVSKTGKVRLSGNIPENAKNPIIKVNYADNRELNYNKHGYYATNVVKKVTSIYHFKKMNMVGHSVGNISIIYYMLQNEHKRNMPILQKSVNIAGHFAGLKFNHIPKSIQEPANLSLNKDGKPNKMNESFKQMARIRTDYPAKQLSILNIIGDIGNKTDGTVSNNSSLSLKYIIGNRAKTYRVKKIIGKNARHSILHENKKVDQILIDFLWYK
ncbi:alpha/beta hydrolase [Leuconostoc pseudomesenteroides]|uniref:alpha/beta hydrolase n=1 Tax=Leuconostoc pseudomesenteroides TaxID=33968 RepID=UPI00345E8288